MGAKRKIAPYEWKLGGGLMDQMKWFSVSPFLLLREQDNRQLEEAAH